jgi:hypothetical protein
MELTSSTTVTGLPAEVSTCRLALARASAPVRARNEFPSMP